MLALNKNIFIYVCALLTGVMTSACQQGRNDSAKKDSGKIHLITLDPAHFHAALVQKTMYPDVDSIVNVYAPKGLGLTEQLNYINQYNESNENPTHWVEKVYEGEDYFQKMLSEQKKISGTKVVITAGNNEKKTEYIKKSIEAGLNVLSDKPMAINSENFDTLKKAFADAAKNGVILYDIMTERSVMATILQRKLLHTASVFGELQQGTSDSPAVIMESVHRYHKQVSGKPLIRPDWFFDPNQEGDAIVDVGTHLVDLVQWICFPEVVLHYDKDIEIQSAKIWPTPLTFSQFTTVTGKKHFPEFLRPYIKDDSVLLAHGNGSIRYSIKGVYTDVTTKWTYDPPAGGGDTYYTLFKGSKANLEIRQGKEEKWKSVLYIWPVHKSAAYEQQLKIAIEDINKEYPGVQLEPVKMESREGWKLNVPAVYSLGHEAHFADVVNRYLNYLKQGKLPEWELSGMMTKYYTTTRALQMAKEN